MIPNPTLKQAIAFNIQEWNGAGAKEEDLLNSVMELIKIHGYKQVNNIPQFSPTCNNCNNKYPIDEFVSEAWLQIPYSADGGEHGTIIWVCPQCSEDIGFKRNVDALIRLQNACGEIKLAGEEAMKCGH